MAWSKSSEEELPEWSGVASLLLIWDDEEGGAASAHSPPSEEFRQFWSARGFEPPRQDDPFWLIRQQERYGAYRPMRVPIDAMAWPDHYQIMAISFQKLPDGGDKLTYGAFRFKNDPSCAILSPGDPLDFLKVSLIGGCKVHIRAIQPDQTWEENSEGVLLHYLLNWGDYPPIFVDPSAAQLFRKSSGDMMDLSWFNES